MGEQVVVPCHVCGGSDRPSPCWWCNGTGDEDYQDRAYDEWRDRDIDRDKD